MERWGDRAESGSEIEDGPGELPREWVMDAELEALDECGEPRGRDALARALYAASLLPDALVIRHGRTIFNPGVARIVWSNKAARS